VELTAEGLRFRSTQVERVDDAHLRVTGQLAIRDVTAEVVLGGFADDPWGNRRAAFTAVAATLGVEIH
jgi:polyisoprenoid-binding protein YceI